MIGKLKGRIEERNEDSVILDVGGVGYEIYCPARLIASFEDGQAAEFAIETHVREDHIHLYGFSDKIEREWFRLLTTVQGVGAKVAMTILGAFAPSQLAQMIVAQDAAGFKRISGVGPKLAQRLITELKDKAITTPTAVFTTNLEQLKNVAKAASGNFSNDAISALVNLGYSRSDAYTAVAHATGKAKENSSVDELIRLGLKELAR